MQPQHDNYDVLTEQNFSEEQAEMPESSKAAKMLSASADRGYFGNKTLNAV